MEEHAQKQLAQHIGAAHDLEKAHGLVQHGIPVDKIIDAVQRYGPSVLTLLQEVISLVRK